jgi:hypothetical protein
MSLLFFPDKPMPEDKILKYTYHKGPYFWRKTEQQKAQNLDLLGIELARHLCLNLQ